MTEPIEAQLEFRGSWKPAELTTSLADGTPVVIDAARRAGFEVLKVGW